MFLSLKTLYRKRTVIWPFYFYTIIRTLSGKEPQFYFIDPYANYSEFKDVDDLIDKVFNVEAIQYKVFGEK